MRIVNKLKRSANSEIFAVTLEDGGLEYPILLQALTNTVYFDALLESGYDFTALPYTFYKDGLNVLDSIPEVIYNPTAEEEQDMIDCLGEQVDPETLRDKMTVSNDSYISIPQTDFRIFSRAELIEYLKSCSIVNLDEDFQPLNYFVHPDALFTMEEYFSEENMAYREIIERRRKISFRKYLKLVAWLKTKGLKNNYDDLDVVDAYFQWGIDGFNTRFTSKSRRSSELFFGVAKGVNPEHAAIKRYEIGIMDSLGTITVREGAKGIRWKTRYEMDFLRKEAIKKLSGEEHMVVELESRTTEEVVYLEAPLITVSYNSVSCMIYNRTIPAISVISEDITAEAVNCEYLKEANLDQVKTISYLKAISKEIVNRKVVKCAKSSYDVLREVGCSPLAALQYLRFNSGLCDSSPKLKVTADGESTISDTYPDGANPLNDIVLLDDVAIRKLLENEELLPAQEELLNDFFGGSQLFDKIGEGATRDANFSITDVFRTLYAAHYILGMSCDEIYQESLKSGDLIYSKNYMTIKIEDFKVDGKITGYYEDLQTYRTSQLYKAQMAIYVTCVAKEIAALGFDRRHVGYEGICVDLQSSEAKMVIATLEGIFSQKVEEYEQSVHRKEKMLKKKRLFAVESIFRYYLKGTMSFPKYLGSTTVEIPNSLGEKIKYCVRPVIESTYYTAHNMVDMNTGDFNWYVVNADITEKRVTPHEGYKIPEYPFSALWNSWDSDKLEILLNKGYLPSAHFVPWGNRYGFDTMLFSYKLLDSPYSLLKYKKDADAYKESLLPGDTITTAPFPADQVYEKIYQIESNSENDEVEVESSTATNYTISGSSILEYYSEEMGIEENHPIRPFHGYDAEDFYVDSVQIGKPIPYSIKPLMILADNFIQIANGEKIGYGRISELIDQGYAVVHVQGRKYLARDVHGKVWEVIV